jgi:hydrogenase/urease accessory protein HupE
MFPRRISVFAVALFLAIAAPTYAHNLPMGGSRWAFGKNTILGFVDLKSQLIAEIKPIKDGHYDLDSASDDQLQHIASDVLQPYVNSRISITVNDKQYPVRVTKLGRNGGDLYTICLSVGNVAFDKPLNEVKIAYSLLLEETSNQHVNLAYGYVSEATGNALQHVFDASPPTFQTTFDSTATVWSVSLKGVPETPAAENNAKDDAAKGNPEGAKDARKNVETNTQSAVVSAKDVVHESSANDGATASTASSSATTATQSKVGEPSSQAAAKWSLWTTFRQFVPLGIEHILTGYDHIAFLLAIIVIELSIGEILKIITAFTLAHSITLLLAALEIVKLNSRFVESVIAFSICYVAVENLFKKKANYRWLITFGFGLIHGFGFASALRELIVGKSNLLLSVLCFNMGVEMGQLLLFFTMLPVLYLLKKQIGFRTVTVGASVCVFAIGFAWLIERVFDLKLLWF